MRSSGGWAVPTLFFLFYHRRIDRTEINGLGRSTVTDALPIRFVNLFLHISFKGRIRPSMRTIRQSVFYRIIMDVIHMGDPIAFIAKGMFQESPLPNASRGITESGGVNGRFKIDMEGRIQNRPLGIKKYHSFSFLQG